jgi:hypothetical protein
MLTPLLCSALLCSALLCSALLCSLFLARSICFSFRSTLFLGATPIFITLLLICQKAANLVSLRMSDTVLNETGEIVLEHKLATTPEANKSKIPQPELQPPRQLSAPTRLGNIESSIVLPGRRVGREYITAMLDTWSPFPYHQCSSEVERCRPRENG